jgi:hypothetical protein
MKLDALATPALAGTSHHVRALKSVGMATSIMQCARHRATIGNKATPRLESENIIGQRFILNVNDKTYASTQTPTCRCHTLCVTMSALIIPILAADWRNAVPAQCT